MRPPNVKILLCWPSVIALHDSLWLGKEKGSIMKSAESGGTILTYS